MRIMLAGVALATLVSCRHDYVKVDMALGRVVVYRNGVAYFERRARLEGDELTLSVPHDKVDDFLKSLTVRDARTQETLPVSFPSQGTTGGATVEMVIKLPKRRSTDLILTYISAAPAWKPSYRVEVGDKGKVRLQGWAVVDNTSGEDWKNVLVGVGSSSALSFRYDLWTIRDIERQTLAGEAKFAAAPPMGASPYGDGNELIGSLGAEDIPVGYGNDPMRAVAGSASVENQYVVDGVNTTGSSPAPGRSFESSLKSSAGGMSAGSANGPSDSATPAPPPEKSAEDKRHEDNLTKVRRMADTIKRNKRSVVIEGVPEAGDADPSAVALSRANTLRNQLIENGVAPANIAVRAGTAKEGEKGGVRVVAETAKPEAQAQGQGDTPIGESHFDSGVAISVERDSSVMVSIIDSSTQGDVVYYYDAESARGNERFAFKAVRVSNPTTSALESGPVTVYGSGGFIGEGLTEQIPPKSIALVPFALDRQVVIERTDSTRERIARLVTIQRGVLTTELKHIRKRELKVTNRLGSKARVYLRHTVEPGWQLEKAPEKFERLGRSHLFRVDLEAGKSETVVIEEQTPMTRTIDLRSPTALDLIAVYLEEGAGLELAEPMRKLISLNKEMADEDQAIASLRERMDDYRMRMNELHVQIVSLKLVKSAGPLMRHLDEKMKDISERVQKATIEVVDHQEKLMMARIRFQDAVAEMSLVPRKEAASAAR